MPTVAIYIRNTNKKFLAEEEPSELINSLLEKHYSGSNRPIEDARNKGTILQEINDMERERDEKLEYCQDPQEAKRITKAYKQTIQALWDEYNAIK